jgi:hypothetical protein
MSVANIARRLGISYQHAYNVLKASNMLPASRPSNSTAMETPSSQATLLKPVLSVEALVRGGFQFSARWVLSDAGELMIDGHLPAAAGVYAFGKDQTVLYVGVATIGLASRLRGYVRPGKQQLTNLRLNRQIRGELATLPFIDIYTATPPDSDWNGLPVDSSAGLEVGLIKKFALPWNIRGVG